jgi:hypothetical protein
MSHELAGPAVYIKVVLILSDSKTGTFVMICTIVSDGK